MVIIHSYVSWFGHSGKEQHISNLRCSVFLSCGHSGDLLQFAIENGRWHSEFSHETCGSFRRYVNIYRRVYWIYDFFWWVLEMGESPSQRGFQYEHCFLFWMIWEYPHCHKTITSITTPKKRGRRIDGSFVCAIMNHHYFSRGLRTSIFLVLTTSPGVDCSLSSIHEFHVIIINLMG